MLKHRVLILAMVVPTLILLTCGAPQKEYTYSKFLFGTPCNITFYYIGDDAAKEIIDVIDLELTRLDSLLNRFSHNSLVSELNRNAQVKAPSDIIHLVNFSDSVSRMTNGLFDITVAPLLAVWGFYTKGDDKLPADQEITRAMKLVGYHKIQIKDDLITLEPGMSVDFGGIAQGYAADRAALILRQRHVKSAIIDIGGEVLTIGKAPQNRPWRVGIRNPRGKGIIETVEVEDSAVSTSGDYEKFFTIDNQRYPHIIDPRTGTPAQEFASVTVFADNATLADALSTAIAIMGPMRGLQFLDSLGMRGIIFYMQKDTLKRVSNR
jgi:thiamine biosynthesis lipoprotein